MQRSDGKRRHAWRTSNEDFDLCLGCDQPAAQPRQFGSLLGQLSLRPNAIDCADRTCPQRGFDQFKCLTVVGDDLFERLDFRPQHRGLERRGSDVGRKGEPGCVVAKALGLKPSCSGLAGPPATAKQVKVVADA